MNTAPQELLKEYVQKSAFHQPTTENHGGYEGNVPGCNQTGHGGGNWTRKLGRERLPPRVGAYGDGAQLPQTATPEDGKDPVGEVGRVN